MPPKKRFTLGFAVCAATGCLVWMALFFFIHDYWTDSNGHMQGPYTRWQVILGAVIMIAAAGLCGWYLGKPGAKGAAIGSAVGLGATVFADWSRTDETGLFMVGVLMIFVGSLIGLGLVSFAASAVSGRRRRA